MTVEEMDNMFEVLYNNITSNQAPGLNSYEKSVFLTKAQDEILKNYFNPKSKGNNTQDGFDDSQKRQIDFSMLTAVVSIQPSDKTKTWVINVIPAPPGGEVTNILDRNDKRTYYPTSSGNTDVEYSPAFNSNGTRVTRSNDTTTPAFVVGPAFDTPLFDTRSNSKSVVIPPMLMAINEVVEVTRNTTTTTLQVVPIRFDEYSRLMSKPFKRPLKYQAWRLINSDVENKADIIIGPGDTLTKYTIRYIRRPNPIIVGNLDGLTIEGKDDATECELDPILHEEILQRAVELAKAAWTTTGQDNLQVVMETGQRSE